MIVTDPALVTTLTLAGLAAFVIAVAAALRGWHDWLALKRLELGSQPGATASPQSSGGAGARIEIADLRERVRRLEAIANGIEG